MRVPILRLALSVRALNIQGVKLLPELLREGRYRTFATGKWHNGEPSCVRAFPRGKSVFIGGMADHTVASLAVPSGEVTHQTSDSNA